ncbi:MAG: small ribosomal subunit Rsm22 family protein [Deltaproteobacteria bacterium]
MEHEIQLTSFQWSELIRLRSRFLSEDIEGGSDYWTSFEVLEAYHHTFAQRIGWKWDAVMREISNKGAMSTLSKINLLDYGCGTGIAAEKIIGILGQDRVEKIFLWDRSTVALKYSCERLTQLYPNLKIVSCSRLEDATEANVVVLSHILNEIEKSELETLKHAISKSEWVVWVEPGTRETSQRLIQIRKLMLPEFQVLAPCPHQLECGMMNSENMKHWCHFFAAPPGQVFTSSFWAEFGKKMKIDLRSLPTSFLCLNKRSLDESKNRESSRVIGRPRFYKGFGKFLVCDERGVSEVKLLERTNREVFKEGKKDVFENYLRRRE